MSAPREAQHRLYVRWDLNDTSAEEATRELEEAIRAQRDIPGVLTIDYGPRPRQVDWEGPSRDFDYAMSLTLDTFENVRAYVPHPIHDALVELIYCIGSNIRGAWIDVSESIEGPSA